MNIWQRPITVKDLNDLNKNTLGEFFEINFTEVGDDYLKATMPVNNKTKQPFGLLHGGASVALAETIGSVASWCAINKELFMGVGVEINASHVKAVTEGIVTAVCNAIKVSGKTHIWEIKIYNQQNEICCVSRFTAMVVPLKK
jgi:1,4-dihydroxy-2-naphthoyl-CoA hydrolase